MVSTHPQREDEEIVRHYGADSLRARIDRLIEDAGLTQRPIPAADLAGLDQFHTGGLAATRELAAWAGVQGADVLDLGSGLGGPARILASEQNCRVHGVDLTPAFVEAAEHLTALCGLAGEASFSEADVLRLPFRQESFDVAWTQHVAMNIADRKAFYSEAWRVLKPGGMLVAFDIMLTVEGGRLSWPLPWASRASESHLLTEPETRFAATDAGFVDFETRHPPADALSLPSPSSAANPLSLLSLRGPSFATAVANMLAGFRGGVLAPVMMRAFRPF